MVAIRKKLCNYNNWFVCVPGGEKGYEKNMLSLIFSFEIFEQLIDVASLAKA